MLSTPTPFGILGTGTIARLLTEAIAMSDAARAVAVGSRSGERAEAFANTHGIARAYGSYEELVADGEVEVIYVATPHPFHFEHSVMALEAGKAVLCEKPFCLNADESRKLIALARRKQLFLMEAMWTRFIPAIRRAKALVDEGAIGHISMLQADFGFAVPFDPKSRLFDPNLGGGALLDVGIYPVSLSSLFFGKPVEISAQAQLGRSGVDERIAITLKHADGNLSNCMAALNTQTPTEAVIMGDGGYITLHRQFHFTQSLTLHRNNREPEQIDCPYPGNGYQFEVEAVCEALAASQTEHPLMPLDESQQIMETLDAMRAQIGLRYPGE